MQQAIPMTDDDAPTIEHPAVQEAAPAPKLVYFALLVQGPSTQPELVETTALPQRTVRYALDRLDEMTPQAIDDEVNYRDARQDVYRAITPG